jgi:Tol biopolymer transport system component
MQITPTTRWRERVAAPAARAGAFAGCLTLLAAAGCGRLYFDELGVASDDAAISDGSADAAPLGPWGTPTLVSLPTVGVDDDPLLTNDLLEMYFNRADTRIYVTSRAMVGAPWSDPVIAPGLAGSWNDNEPSLTADGLTMYFSSDRAPSTGGSDIWMVTRPNRAASWTAATRIIELSSTADDSPGAVSSDGLRMVMTSTRNGNYQIFSTTRPTTAAAWSTPVLLGGIDQSGSQSGSSVSSDELSLYYSTSRDGSLDVFVATRLDATAMFSGEAPVVELNSPSADLDPWVAPDGRYVVLCSDRGGARRLWEAAR